MIWLIHKRLVELGGQKPRFCSLAVSIKLVSGFFVRVFDILHINVLLVKTRLCALKPVFYGIA
jgi:hypothetical protein